MRISRISESLIGFPIIHIDHGKILGKVEDVLVDLDKKRIAALVTSKGSPLNRQIEAISGDKVVVWGEDVILVSDGELMDDPERLTESAQWQLVSKEIKGKHVLSSIGERIAELNDVLIDAQGEVIGYDFSKVAADSPLEKTKRAHVRATQTLGPDALILNTEQLENWEVA